MKENQKGGKTAKGITKNVKKYIRKNIKQNDYINTLFNNEQIYHKVKTIRSVNRELGSYEVIVTRHLAFDDKRYMHEDGVTCYASGHY